MISIGTPFTTTATRVMLLGAGELGKEVIIELQRYGVETIAVDRYPNAPGMQVADRSYVIKMLNAKALGRVVEKEKPDLIVPEVEAIATEELLKLEGRGYTVIPTARAVWLTMNREGIRRLAAEELKIPTSRYRFASSLEEFKQAVEEIGCPCVVKPIMSSSGKGQSTLFSLDESEKAWHQAQAGARGGADKVIVESFVDFDYEITLLTVRHVGGVSFCEPIGHRQERGDYRESWQPHPMSDEALQKAKQIAGAVTESLGGRGIFGVELFVKGDEVIFSEVSPRPHDTGMVTMISQDLSEFALHARAILGLPIPSIRQLGPSASSVLQVEGNSDAPRFTFLDEALDAPDTQLRLFGKPGVKGERRLGVALALADTIDHARAKANRVISKIKTELDD